MEKPTLETVAIYLRRRYVGYCGSFSWKDLNFAFNAGSFASTYINEAEHITDPSIETLPQVLSDLQDEIEALKRENCDLQKAVRTLYYDKRNSSRATPTRNSAPQ